MIKHPSVDEYLAQTKQWQKELMALRQIVLETELSEDYKWSNPCYTYNGKNVAMIGGFKAHCFVSFFKGVLLNDPNNRLQFAGSNSQAGKLFKFTNIQEILDSAGEIKVFIDDAIKHEQLGTPVPTPAKDNLELVPELSEFLNANPDIQHAFMALTPGRQRGYNIHVGGAKQSATRINRIEKCVPRILQGKGFHDCICGHSKRMPTCDGSHKYI